MRVRVVLCFALALAAGLLGMTPAPAVTKGVVVTQGFKYYPGDTSLSAEDGSRTALIVVQGGSITLVNTEVNFQGHSITAIDVVPGTDTPLFDSGVIQPPKTGEVAGIASLAPGLYKFRCSLEFHNMFGYLNVVGIPGG